MVIDATEQQQQAPLVLYAAPSSDITKAIVDAYNAKSGVPAPPPEASCGSQAGGRSRQVSQQSK